MPQVIASYDFTYNGDPYIDTHAVVGEAEEIGEQLNCERFLRGILMDAGIDVAALEFDEDYAITLGDLVARGFWFNNLSVEAL